MSFGMFTKARATNIAGAACLALFNAGVAFAAPLLEAIEDYAPANTTTTTPAPSPSSSPLSIPEIVGITLGIAAMVGIITYGLKSVRILDLFCCEGDNVPDALEERRGLVGD